MSNLAKLFVTDYASYNNGEQFILGKWWDLEDFTDADEFLTAVSEYFEENGKTDLELMFTDFEGFPKHLYGESMSETDIQKIYDIADLYDLIENGSDSDLVNLHNTACDVLQRTDDQIFDFDESFFDTFFEGRPMEAARAASFGDINWGGDYIRFNGYGNLESIASVHNEVDEGMIYEAFESNPREFNL